MKLTKTSMKIFHKGETHDLVEYLDRKYYSLIVHMQEDFALTEEEIWQILDKYRKSFGYPDID